MSKEEEGAILDEWCSWDALNEHLDAAAQQLGKMDVLFLTRVQYTSGFARGVLIAGSVLLLCALGSAFTAQASIGGADGRDDAPLKTAAGSASVWPLVAGLALAP